MRVDPVQAEPTADEWASIFEFFLISDGGMNMVPT
jgi:hypothetical protein